MAFVNRNNFAAYYSENDPFCAEWLRNLIAAGEIMPGDVDERSIWDVAPIDLHGYTQHHFFAGIGIWSYALRQAGWPDEHPVWTGSCPCQPFSSAGARRGFADERHLWPAWFHLIGQCRPDAIYFEQVASGDGKAWLDLVFDDLDGSEYTIGAVDFPSCGVGAPNRRNRYYGLAHANRCDWRPETAGRHIRDWSDARWPQGDGEPSARGDLGRVEDASVLGLQAARQYHGNYSAARTEWQAGDFREPSSSCNGFWDRPRWVYCDDPGQSCYRPVEAGTFPLAPRHPGRMGALSAYGNALNAEVATAFIAATIYDHDDRSTESAF